MKSCILHEAEYLMPSLNVPGGKLTLVSLRQRAVPTSMRRQSQKNWLGTGEDAETAPCYSVYSQPPKSYPRAECSGTEQENICYEVCLVYIRM